MNSQQGYIVYTHKLVHQKIYVGITKISNQAQRDYAHLTGKACTWTSIFSVTQNDDKCETKYTADENRITKQNMWKNGVHKVRGGTFAHTYLDIDELESIFRELYDVTQKCYRCLGDHFMQQCKQISDDQVLVRGFIPLCLKCFQLGHYQDWCDWSEIQSDQRVVRALKTIYCWICFSSRKHLPSQCKLKQRLSLEIKKAIEKVEIIKNKTKRVLSFQRQKRIKIFEQLQGNYDVFRISLSNGQFYFDHENEKTFQKRIQQLKSIQFETKQVQDKRNASILSWIKLYKCQKPQQILFKKKSPFFTKVAMINQIQQQSYRYGNVRGGELTEVNLPIKKQQFIKKQAIQAEFEGDGCFKCGHLGHRQLKKCPKIILKNYRYFYLPKCVHCFQFGHQSNQCLLKNNCEYKKQYEAVVNCINCNKIGQMYSECRQNCKFCDKNHKDPSLCPLMITQHYYDTKIEVKAKRMLDSTQKMVEKNSHRLRKRLYNFRQQFTYEDQFLDEDICYNDEINWNSDADDDDCNDFADDMFYEDVNWNDEQDNEDYGNEHEYSHDHHYEESYNDQHSIQYSQNDHHSFEQEQEEPDQYFDDDQQDDVHYSPEYEQDYPNDQYGDEPQNDFYDAENDGFSVPDPDSYENQEPYQESNYHDDYDDPNDYEDYNGYDDDFS